MRCQRRILRVFWQQHISNRSIRERTNQPTTSSLLRRRRPRRFGHLHRWPSSLPVRRVVGFNPNNHGWKRPRGRPTTNWVNSIKHDLHSAGLNTINAAQMVYDRPQRKAFVCGLPTLEPEHGLPGHWPGLNCRCAIFPDLPLILSSRNENMRPIYYHSCLVDILQTKLERISMTTGPTNVW